MAVYRPESTNCPQSRIIKRTKASAIINASGALAGKPLDYRSPEAAAYRKLYNLPIWRGKHGLRQQQLTRQPLCERCIKAGHITIATVVNHRKPHKGDFTLFADPSNLESACKPHHDGDIQSEEIHGFSNAIGADGWPTDDRHPSNR